MEKLKIAAITLACLALVAIIAMGIAMHQLQVKQPNYYTQYVGKEVTAYDSRGAHLGRRVVYPTQKNQLILVGRIVQLPVLNTRESHHTLDIGDLVFNPTQGLMEVGPNGKLIPIVVQLGQRVQLIKPPSMKHYGEKTGFAVYSTVKEWRIDDETP